MSYFDVLMEIFGLLAISLGIAIAVVLIPCLILAFISAAGKAWRGK